MNNLQFGLGHDCTGFGCLWLLNGPAKQWHYTDGNGDQQQNCSEQNGFHDFIHKFSFSSFLFQQNQCIII